MDNKPIVGVFDPYKHEKIIKRGLKIELDEATAKQTEKEKPLFFTNEDLKRIRNQKTYEQKSSQPLFKFAKGKISYNPETVFNPRYVRGKGKQTFTPSLDYWTRKAREVFS